MTRMLAAAAALITIFILFAVYAGHAAFAQDVIAVTPTSPLPEPESTWAGMIVIMRESFTAALLAVATTALAWFATKIQAWTGGRIDLNETIEAVEWERYVDSAAAKAFAYAQSKAGITPEKLDSLREKDNFLAWALRYIGDHHDDIVSYLDKNGNNVIDVLETRLVGLAPDKVFPGVDVEETKPVRRKAAPADVDKTIAKFAPKTGAVN